MKNKALRTAAGATMGYAVLGPPGAVFGALFGALFEDSEERDEGEDTMPSDTGSTPSTGSSFAEEADKLSNDQQRQDLFLDWFSADMVPSWLLDWKVVQWTAKDKNGVDHDVQIQVSPDYLSVGTDDDPLVAVLGFPNALRLALERGFVLPTSMVVDQIWKSAEQRYEPAPLPPTSGSTMRRPGYWLQSRDKMIAQGWPGGYELQAGHKKDVVVSKQLVGKPGRLAIYGWHKSDGKPIQPVSLFHGADYADYSHGIRAIHPDVLVDGQLHDFRDLLSDPTLSSLVSKEGPFSYDDATKTTGVWNMV
jgi:hypothetical protein